MRYVARFVDVEDVFVSRVTTVVHTPVGDLDMDPEVFAQVTSGSRSFSVVKHQKAWTLLMRAIKSESDRSIMRHSESPRELRDNMRSGTQLVRKEKTRLDSSKYRALRLRCVRILWQLLVE